MSRNIAKLAAGVSLALSTFAFSLSIMNAGFQPTEIKPNIYVVNEQKDIMMKIGATWGLGFKDCQVLENSLIGVAVNGTNTLAIVQKGTEEGEGIVMFESLTPVITAKALVPCGDTSIKEIDVKLKKGWYE